MNPQQPMNLPINPMDLFLDNGSTPLPPVNVMDALFLHDARLLQENFPPPLHDPLALGMLHEPSSSGSGSGSDSSDNNGYHSPHSPHSPDSPDSFFVHPMTPNDMLLPPTPTMMPVTGRPQDSLLMGGGLLPSSAPAPPPAKPKRTYTRRKPRKTPDVDSSLLVDDPANTAGLNENQIRELLEEKDLKQKRLARKAELARMSRKRKKMRLCDLEEEVSRLQNELDRVRKHRKLDQEMLVKQAQQLSEASWGVPSSSAAGLAGAAPNVTGGEDSAQHLAQAVKRVIAVSQSPHSSPANQEAAVGQSIEDMMGVLNRRELAAKNHLLSLEESLGACLPLKFLQWCMTQSDKFYADPSGLWNSLFTQDIGASPEQMAELHALRAAVKTQQAVCGEVEAAYAKLNELLRTHLSNSSANFTTLRSILTPSQLAKFFSWVERFGPVCVKINL